MLHDTGITGSLPSLETRQGICLLVLRSLVVGQGEIKPVKEKCPPSLASYDLASLTLTGSIWMPAVEMMGPRKESQDT